MRILILVALVSYLIGSIPFGYLLVRAFRGADIRQSGSGNIGATNVARASPLLGFLTLLLDALKGFGAVYLASRGEILASIAPDPTTLLDQGLWPLPSDIYARCVLAAFFAIVGHMFPVWLKFRGGKGVATGLGSFILLAPRAVLVMIAVFLVVAAIFRYVSLASIIAVALFPLLAWLFHDYHDIPLALALMTVCSLLIITKHHENIRRLLTGNENRFGANRS
jgi:glycerol-3-phosphate acyltransferase PlsY